MSFLIYLSKNKQVSSPNLDLLGERLCPYQKRVTQLDLKNFSLFYTEISEYIKIQDEKGKIKTPKSHLCESNSAWLEINWNQNNLSIDTDPMGQCPVWYYESEELILISSEQKALCSIEGVDFKIQEEDYFLKVHQRKRTDRDFLKIYRLPPGASLGLNFSNKEIQITGGVLPWDEFQVNEKLTIGEAQLQLKKTLEKSASEVPSQKLGCFLSGGIDSSVAAALCKNIVRSYNLKTEIGDEEKESKETSLYLGIESQTIFLEDKQLINLWKKVVSSNEISDGLTAETVLQMEALIEKIPQDIQNIVTGYGADLLFGGMLGHKEYLQITGTNDTATLLDRTYWSKEFSPFFYWAQGKRLFHLYWHPEVIKAALSIPLRLQQQKPGSEKFILRSLAVKEKWLTEELAFRTKKAMTNGTNVNALFSKMLGLKNEYSYAEKTQLSFNHFKKSV
ncbi:MAG: hypothetical protein KDD45_01235 [Bdellovibrionales bacterium]|nr:hypothetical protein [Bdellovibrionales bacterium]